MFRKRLPGYSTVGLRAIISALVRWPIRVWPVTVIVIVITATGFLLLPQALNANAYDGETSTVEDCLGCHTRTLKGHDKLGLENKACWVCHDKTDMGMLHLADETQLPLSDSPQLCGQCHQQRYNAWKEEIHGLPGPSNEKCTSCHNPHQPQIALLNITEPPPQDKLSTSPPSLELLRIFGISLLLLIAAGVVVVVTRSEEP